MHTWLRVITAPIGDLHERRYLLWFPMELANDTSTVVIGLSWPETEIGELTISLQASDVQAAVARARSLDN
ncbi:MAG: hypothetical protein JWN95_4079 [Frankiales bacterium]|nr:hypothetical protein [Frankiales bacterium]